MSFLSGFLVASLVSIGVAGIGVYPVFFSFFVILYFCFGFKIKVKLFIPVAGFVFISTFSVFINLNYSFDFFSFLKLYINFLFLLVASSYFISVPFSESFKILKTSSVIFIFISFLQSLYLVYELSLWGLPLNISNSSSAYAIQEGSIYFGAQNKNIWASKVAIFSIILFFCWYQERRFGFICFIFVLQILFCMAYVSSRTAQIALLSFLVILIFHYFWILRRKRIFFAIIFFPLFLLIINIIQFIVRLDISIFSEFSFDFGGHGGDGFLSRLIVWNYAINAISLNGLIMGNGLLSFSNLTSNYFSENNAHNVFLNIILDLGIFSFFFYLFVVFVFFKGRGAFFFLIPFLVFSNSQYLGYDADLMVLFLVALYAQIVPHIYFSRDFSMKNNFNVLLSNN